MTALTLQATATAVAVNCPATFYASGGTAPYAYVVLAGGAGGFVDAATGAYTAPSTAGATPLQAQDTVQVTDNVGATATAVIMVGTPVMLLADIVQQYMGLSPGRTYLWDQRIPQPSDAGLYVAVSVPFCRPFASTRRLNPATGNTDQAVSMQATVDLDLISRDASARDRSPEAVLALNSDYALSQQYNNGFRLALLPKGFVNLSEVDGAAIPYRYRISVNILYAATKSQSAVFYTSLNFAVTVDGGATVSGTITGGAATSTGDVIDGGGAL